MTSHSRFPFFIALWALLSAPLSGQPAAPAINPGGVVNAASYTAPVAPGSLASVFGTFPLSAPVSASGMPLPTSLTEFSMQFEGGVALPLIFASSTQANVQIPWELAGSTAPLLTAAFAGDESSPQPVQVAPFAPAIFAMNQQGSGPGAIQDSAYRLVDASNPAVAGSTYILIYCTGLGAVTNQPATGAAASATPLSETTTPPTVTVGGADARVLFAGLAPGYAGLYQVNVQVPGNAGTGDAVPVTISMGGVTSNTVTIPVLPPVADQRAAATLAQMTLDEKLQLVHGTSNGPQPLGAGGWIAGIPHLGIPDLYMVDGSVGLGNGVGPATALPSSIASAAAWDLDLAYQYGKVIGAEMRNYGVNVNLGGNVNLSGREPRGGRTFETKGEDPVLAGRITAAHIRGIQDQHVIGGMKHFAFNDQETGRWWADVRIDERGGRESDLLAFEIALKDSDVQSVMCSYNLLNGLWACQSPYLLTDVLKGDWGFKGFVMSDWWALDSPNRAGAAETDVASTAALAGLDQEQPNDKYFGHLKQAIQQGTVPESRLDDMAKRILRAMYAVGLPENSTPVPADWAADATVAEKVEEQGAVLLKNAGGLLPLDAATVDSIAVIGWRADSGVLSGGGSAQVYPTGAINEGQPCGYGLPCWAPVIWDPSSPIRAIRAKVPSTTAVLFNDGVSASSAAAIASHCAVAVVFVSQWASEGMDLPSLDFTDLIHTNPIGQHALVAAVAAANPHTIVVLENGGPQTMPWLDSVPAVLEAWYPGSRGGEAIANLLFGDVNPSGKLPMTFFARTADLPRPTIAGTPEASAVFAAPYAEGFRVGYKWAEAQNLTPLFPFGFGLSYTTFSIANAAVTDNLHTSAPNLQVSFDVANTGERAGAEVAQVYLGLPTAAGEPRRLVGWQKVFLQPGEMRRATVAVYQFDSSHPLSYWDGGWKTAPGDYTMYVGDSSRNLSVAGTFHVD